MEKSNKYGKKGESHSNDLQHAVLVILFYIVMAFVVYGSADRRHKRKHTNTHTHTPTAQHQYLPTPIEKDVDPVIMSEMRAFEHIEEITKMGIRTVGSTANREGLPGVYSSRNQRSSKRSPRESDVDIEVQHVSDPFI